MIADVGATPLRKGLARLVIAVPLVLAGCGPSPGLDPPVNQVLARTSDRPGKVLVEVSTGVVHFGASAPGDRYWRYELDPSAGRVVQTEAGVGELKDSRFETGRRGCDKYGSGTQTVESPNGLFQVQCSGEWRTENARFVVADVVSKKVLFRWAPTTLRRVRGFAWSPMSDHVAILSYSQRTRRTNLLDFLLAGSGHPPPYVTFYLDLINVTGGVMSEYVLRTDVEFGEGAILDWTPPPARE